MKTELLSDEELKLIKTYREDQARKADIESLEEKFAMAVEETRVNIEEKLDKAKSFLEAAVRLSEENGIPFVSTIIDIESLGKDREYQPKSFIDKWGSFNSTRSMQDNNGIYMRMYGWQDINEIFPQDSWNSSGCSF